MLAAFITALPRTQHRDKTRFQDAGLQAAPQRHSYLTTETRSNSIEKQRGGPFPYAQAYQIAHSATAKSQSREAAFCPHISHPPPPSPALSPFITEAHSNTQASY